MDSKQLATLHKMPTTVTAHTLQDICTRKIIVNRITATFLQTQIQLSELSKKLQDYSIDNAKNKLVLVQELCKLYEEQYAKFEQDRQTECMEIYKLLNELNVCPDYVQKMVKELGELDSKLKDLAERIDYYEKDIPMEQDGIQCMGKIQVGTGATCAQEYTLPE